MDLGPHAIFIIAAYGAAAVVVAALIAWVALDFRAQKRMLGDLETHGDEKCSSNDGTVQT